MITGNQAPALVTKSSLMCWYPGVAGLVAVPLLLLEVEVEVLLQVVGVKLALGGHNRHLREKFNWALFYFPFHSRWFSCQRVSKLAPTSRPIPFLH